MSSLHRLFPVGNLSPEGSGFVLQWVFPGMALLALLVALRSWARGRRKTASARPARAAWHGVALALFGLALAFTEVRLYGDYWQARRVGVVDELPIRAKTFTGSHHSRAQRFGSSRYPTYAFALHLQPRAESPATLRVGVSKASYDSVGEGDRVAVLRHPDGAFWMLGDRATIDSSVLILALLAWLVALGAYGFVAKSH